MLEECYLAQTPWIITTADRCVTVIRCNEVTILDPLVEQILVDDLLYMKFNLAMPEDRVKWKTSSPLGLIYTINFSQM